MRNVSIGILLVVVMTLGGAPAFGQAATSEASGEVADKDGNPLQDAAVTFAPKSNPSTVFSEKTSKKGRYFLPSLFTTQGDEWLVTVEYKDWVPVEMYVESRTGTRVLLTDPFTIKLKPNSGPWTVRIRPLGSAKINFTLVPPDQVAQPVATAGGQAVVQQAPQKDPWDEALRLAGGGDLAGSIPLFEEAIDDEPEAGDRRGAVAKVLYQLGRYDEAEAQALAAVEMNPEDVDGRMVLYSIYMAQNDLDSAKQTLEETRAIAPGDLRILRQLAVVANEAGSDEDAIAAWEAVTEVDPEDTEAWMTLGDIYARTGDSQRSEQAYQRVVELDPSGAHQIFYNLGALIINREDRTDADTDKAIGAFRKAVELKPDYAQAYKQLGFALLSKGDRGGAKEALEQYVKYAPDAPDAAQMKAIVGTLSK